MEKSVGKSLSSPNTTTEKPRPVRRSRIGAAARGLIPPLFLKVLRRIVSGEPMMKDAHGEKDADWYDQAFEESTAQNVHYTESPYYPIWTIIMDRVRTEADRSILEIACGAGQLARALQDSNLIESYYGFDFSPRRVARAKSTSPELTFEVLDAFSAEIFEVFPYNIAIATEFLEHVEEDLVVLKRIKPGTRFLGTVPNYPWKSHVRHFRNVDDVLARYGECFAELDVFPVLRKESGQTIFVMDGKKK